ncbi:hypothetical protein NADE_000804 [Nannochloris sp. 'desiccata']|nr:hypothetical protein NADE_000804 [Chlorella desiccata (nom. nud.)]
MATLQVFDEFKDSTKYQTTTGNSALAPKVQGELQTWLSKVLQAGPNEALTKLLRGHDKTNTRVTSVINQANSLIGAAFPQVSGFPPKGGQKANRGLAQKSQTSSQPEKEASKKRMLCLSLYKFCLHRVLLLSLEGLAASLKLASVPELPDFDQHLALDSVLQETEMLAGLVQACAEIVTYVHLTSVSESFPTCSLRMGRKTQWLELLQGLTWMRHCQAEMHDAGKEEGMLPGLLGFPVQLNEYVLAMEKKILSELLFVPGSTFFPRAQEHGIYKPTEAFSVPTIAPNDVKRSMRRLANAIVLTTTIKKISRLAEQKARELCHYLWISSNVSSISGTSHINEDTFTKLETALQNAVLAMVNSLLYRHLDLMYGRHLTVIVIGIVCCTAKICGFKVKFPAVLKAAVTYFDYEDVEALGEVSLDSLLSMKMVERKKERMNNVNGGRGACGGVKDEGSESDEGWNSSDSSEDHADFEFYNKVMVPLVTLYINADDDTVADLLGSTQKEVMDALDSVGVEIELDARKLYAKGRNTDGSSQQTSITANTTSIHRYQSQSQETPPSKLLGVSGGGKGIDGNGAGRSMAKKPGSRTPLAALTQKKKKHSTN